MALRETMDIMDRFLRCCFGTHGVGRNETITLLREIIKCTKYVRGYCYLYSRVAIIDRSRYKFRRAFVKTFSFE